MPRALVTGITGQDGSYLAELLLAKGYEVWGLIRRSSSFNTGRIDHLYQDPHRSPRLRLIYGDLHDSTSIANALEESRPDEVYNLAGQSHVRVSFDIPEYTGEICGLGPLRILEGLRRAKAKARYFQASSSEMFGNVSEVPQSETTRFRPRSPYGAAKVYAFHLTQNYREAYGMHASNGVLFNHESPRRGETFVSRKITRAATRIKLGLQDKVYLGNLDAKRDWGFAGDYVKGIWLMLQADTPGDFVLATREPHSVREFAECAFALLGLDYRQHVEIDARYLRPTEVDLLCGDYSKAKRELGWEPEVRFEKLISMMVAADLELARSERALTARGAVRTNA